MGSSKRNQIQDQKCRRETEGLDRNKALVISVRDSEMEVEGKLKGSSRSKSSETTAGADRSY